MSKRIQFMTRTEEDVEYHAALIYAMNRRRILALTDQELINFYNSPSNSPQLIKEWAVEHQKINDYVINDFLVYDDQKHRLSSLQFWIDVASRCLEQQNLAGVFMLSAPLKQLSDDFTNTFSKLSNSYKDKLNTVLNFTSNEGNFKAYRDANNTLDEFTIASPLFFGKDLVPITDDQKKRGDNYKKVNAWDDDVPAWRYVKEKIFNRIRSQRNAIATVNFDDSTFDEVIREISNTVQLPQSEYRAAKSSDVPFELPDVRNIPQAKHTAARNWISQAYQHRSPTLIDDEFNIHLKYVEDPQHALAGTSGAFEVKRYYKNSYDKAKLSDLIERSQVIHDTAVTRVDDMPLNDAEKTALTAWIDEQHDKLNHRLTHNCLINPEESEDQTVEKIKLGAKLIRQYLIDVIHATSDKPSEDGIVTQAEIDTFYLAENQLIKKMGRPNVMHMYEIGDQLRISAAQTEGQVTIPSTIRDEPGVVNFVRTQVGRVKSRNNIDIQFVGYRHASFSPLRLQKDTKYATAMHREYQTYHNAVQYLQTLAQSMVDDLNDADDIPETLTIPVSSMHLLSPSWIDVPGVENETRQVEESFKAFMMCHQRKQTIKVNRGGREVEVDIKPDINFMNIPANFKTRSFFITQRPYINYRGFVNYSAQMNNYFNQALLTGFTTTNNPALDKKVDLLYENMYTLMQQYHTDDELSERKQRLARLESAHELETDYNQLELLYQQFTDPDQLYDESAQYKQIQKLKKSIEKKEANLAKAYQSVLKRQKELFITFSQQDGRNLLEQSYDITSFCKTHNIDAPEIEKFCDLTQLYFDSQKLFFNRDHYTYSHTHDLQARMALSQYKLGQYVDIVCKSSEDRSGRLQNYIEELCVFHDEFGHYPDAYHTTHRGQLDDIAPVVNEFSINREIAHHNVPGARGLQQDYESRKPYMQQLRVNKNIRAKQDRTLAKIAKTHLYEEGTTQANNFYSIDAGYEDVEELSDSELLAQMVESTDFEDIDSFLSDDFSDSELDDMEIDMLTSDSYTLTDEDSDYVGDKYDSDNETSSFKYTIGYLNQLFERYENLLEHCTVNKPYSDSLSDRLNYLETVYPQTRDLTESALLEQIHQANYNHYRSYCSEEELIDAAHEYTSFDKYAKHKDIHHDAWKAVQKYFDQRKSEIKKHTATATKLQDKYMKTMDQVLDTLEGKEEKEPWSLKFFSRSSQKTTTERPALTPEILKTLKKIVQTPAYYSDFNRDDDQADRIFALLDEGKKQLNNNKPPTPAD